MILAETTGDVPGAAVSNDGLPEGWALAKFGDIAAIKGGVTKGQKRRAKDVLRAVPYLRVANVQRGYLDLQDVKEIEATEDEIAELRLLPGDILLIEGGNREHLGRGWVWQGEIPECIHQNHIFRARLRDPQMQPRFFSWYANHVGQEYFNRQASQTVNLASINLKKLSSLPVAVPPAAEQKRIVAKVEALLARVDAAGRRLVKVPAILKRFRQAVLAAACSGRLTRDWREEQQATEMATVVLEKLYQERYDRAKTRSSGLASRLETMVKPVIPEWEGFRELPPEWVWCRVEDLCQPERALTYGVIKLGPTVSDGVPTLRSSDVRHLFLDEANVKTIGRSIADQFARTYLQGGEILVTVRGTLGGVAVVPPRMKGFNVSREVAVLPVEPSLSGAYLAYAIGSLSSQNWLHGQAKGVAYTGVNIEDLRLLPIPIPPLTEQREIVRRVEALFRLGDAIEKRVALGTGRVKTLTGAILAKAFRGELVPPEADLAARV